MLHYQIIFAIETNYLVMHKQLTIRFERVNFLQNVIEEAIIKTLIPEKKIIIKVLIPDYYLSV